MYDKWNKRFRSRRKVLRVVDIKRRIPVYYRAKEKFKSFAKENFDVVGFPMETNSSKTSKRLQLIGIFGNSQRYGTKGVKIFFARLPGPKPKLTGEKEN